MSQVQQTCVSFGWCPDNEQINERSVARQYKFLIMMTEIKALLEGGQRLYTKIATAQGLVLIQKRNEYRTR